jgi:hypothetical protein
MLPLLWKYDYAETFLSLPAGWFGSIRAKLPRPSNRGGGHQHSAER